MGVLNDISPSKPLTRIECLAETCAKSTMVDQAPSKRYCLRYFESDVDKA